MTELFEHGYALIIGVDENKIGGMALPVVERDVTALYDVLVHPERCAYEPQNVRLLMGEDATGKNIVEALLWLKDKVEADPQATAVITYAGHGLRDKQTEQYYLIPYDIESLSRVRSDALRAQELLVVIEEFQARHTFIIFDCNHSMGIDAVPIETDESGLESAAFPEFSQIKKIPAVEAGGDTVSKLVKAEGLAVLSSSTGNERSYVRPDQKMGVFTYHLIEALTGHAPHNDGDTEVLVTSVLRWVGKQVKKSAAEMNKAQTPFMRASADFAIAKLVGGQGAQSTNGFLAPDPLEHLPNVGFIPVTGGGGDDEWDMVEMVGSDYLGLPEFAEMTIDMVPPMPQAVAVSRSDPITQARRFEAAMPKDIRAGETTELLVMIPRADGPGLSKYLPITAVSGDEINKDDVVAADAQIEFPVPGEPVLVYISVEATDYDYDIDEPDRAVKLYADRDGSYESFLLTPLRAASKTRVTVNLYGDEARTNKLSTIRLAVGVIASDSSTALILNRTMEYAVGRAPVTINVIEGDQIAGDKVAGNKITANVSGGAVAIGDGAAATAISDQGGLPAAVDELFEQLIKIVAPAAPLMAVHVLNLKDQVENGLAADDAVIAGLILDIAGAVDSSKSVLVAIFSHPHVAVIIENMGATTFAISRME